MHSQVKPLPYAYWAAFIATTGSFLLSYVSYVIAGSLFFIAQDFNLSPSKEGHLASIIVLGALVGACCTGSSADYWGRRRTFILSTFLYLIPSIAIFFTSSYSLLLILRFLTGVPMGMTSILVPLYLAEIAPAKYRGAFVTSFQVSITIGTLVAYLGNYTFHSSGDWRSMLALAALPAAFQLLCFFSFPESPKWLFGKGQFEKGNQVLKRLQGIQLKNTETKFEKPKSSWHELLKPVFKKGILIGILLSIFQQLSGINAIMYFTPKIFGKAGIDNVILSTLLVGVVNLLSTFTSFFLVDRMGRKKLLLISQCGIIFSLLAIIVGFATETQWINLFAILTYVSCYSLGLGPVTWVLISEIYPLSIRAKALSIMMFLNWLTIYLVILIFPYFLFNIGYSLTFSLFTVFAFIALVLYWRLVPETKGKTLEEIESMLYPSDQAL